MSLSLSNNCEPGLWALNIRSAGNEVRLCQPWPCAVDGEDFRIGFAVVDMASVLQWYDCSFLTSFV